MSTIRFKGAAARNFFAALTVASDGEKALDNTCGPMREAIQAELERQKPKVRVPICLSCGAHVDSDGALPCGH